MRRYKGELGLSESWPSKQNRSIAMVGHVERKKEGRLVKKINRSVVTGIRPRGRLCTGWMDSVKRALDGNRDFNGARRSDCA